MLAGEATLCCIKFIENATARFEIEPARLRERKASRGPGQQAHPELLLESGEVPAHRRQRHVQAPPRAGQTPGIGNRNEDTHGGKTVHFILPNYGKINWNNRQYFPEVECAI